MKDARDIIIRPRITERSMEEAANKRYTFEVDRRANKIEIANAIEEIFGVEVEKVNTINMKGKVKHRGRQVGKRRDWKKAIVTLTPESEEIEFGG